MIEIDDKLLRRLIPKFKIGDGCWLWTACINKNGYGQFRVGSNMVGAHRVTYTWLRGPLTPGLELDHVKGKCTNRHCVNPWHLEEVTHAENNHRSVRGERGNKELAKTHCIKGHPYIEENIYRFSSTPNKRICKICKNDRDKKWWSKNRSKLVEVDD